MLWRGVEWSAVQCSAVKCVVAWCRMECSAVQCSAVQCVLAWCRMEWSAVQCSAVWRGVEWSTLLYCGVMSCDAERCALVKWCGVKRVWVRTVSRAHEAEGCRVVVLDLLFESSCEVLAHRIKLLQRRDMRGGIG